MDPGVATLDLRMEFPASSHYRAYLNTASIGLPPKRSIEAMAAASRLFASDVSRAESIRYELIDRIAMQFSNLYGFEPTSIGVGESTTHCVYRLALSRPGVNAIGFSYEEFPGIVRAIESGCRLRGCRVRVYSGETVEESVKAAVDDGVDVLVVSAVTWVTGYRVDLAGITRYAAKRDTLVIVDSVQHFGALSLRDGEASAHAYAASVKKWLITPHASLGICVVSKKMLGFQPVFHGLGNLAISDWSEYWSDEDKAALPSHDLRSDGHRYSAPTGLSTPNLAAFEASLGLLTSLGIDRIEAHIMGLKDLLLDLLRDYKIDTFQDQYPRSHHSSIIAVKAGASLARKIASSLAGEGILVSPRGQSGLSGLRISIHLYNSEEDVRLVAERLRRTINS